MSRTYKRITADLDPERGNAVTIRREDVAPLVKSLPTEVTAPIIDAFIRWFCNVAEPEIKDALARAVLEQFKERQREAVKRYVAVCDSRRPDKTSEPDGETQVETTTHKPLNKEKVKNEVNEVNTSVLYGDASVTPSGGDSTPSASPPTAVIGSVIGKDDVLDARKAVARYAPEPKFILAFDPADPYQPKELDCKKYCDDEGRRKCREAAKKGKCLTTCANLDDEHWVDGRIFPLRELLLYDDKYRDDKKHLLEWRFWGDYSRWEYAEGSLLNDGIHEIIINDLICEEPTKQLQAALDNFDAELGETFKRAVWTFYIEKNAHKLPDKDKDGNATNYGKLLFGRLKKLVEAKAILAQVDETRQRPMPPPPTPPRSAQ